MKISEDQLVKRHRGSDCLYWNLFLALPFISACIAIGRVSILWLIGYIALTLLILAVVIFRFFCTHCPHYVQAEKKVQCMFIWGVPKYFKDNDQPYSVTEKIVIILALIVWIAFPLYWLYRQIGLLTIYILCLSSFTLTLWKYECVRCLHFNCPANRVSEDVRKQVQEGES